MNLNKERQNLIAKTIFEKKIKTQDELLEILKINNYSVTQATLSRDLKTLKAGKFTDHQGNRFYALPQNRDNNLQNHIRIYEIDFSGNMCVLKVNSGYADIVAMMIDTTQDSGILGTIAGDDTVFAVIKSNAVQEEVKEILAKIFPSFKESGI